MRKIYLRPFVEFRIMLYEAEGHDQEWALRQLEAMPKEELTTKIATKADEWMFGKKFDEEAINEIVRFLALSIMAGITTFDFLERSLPNLMGRCTGTRKTCSH